VYSDSYACVTTPIKKGAVQAYDIQISPKREVNINPRRNSITLLQVSMHAIVIAIVAVAVIALIMTRKTRKHTKEPLHA